MPTLFKCAGGERAFLARTRWTTPGRPMIRTALRAYVHSAVADVLVYSPVEAVVDPGEAIPRWSGDGLAR